MRVGDYETVREIGRGGVGSVFEARGRDGARVAIKLLRPGATEDTKARFEREQRLQAALGEAKGFVPFVDAGDSPAGPYVVMPLLEGGTLRDRLRRGQPLPPDEAVALVATLARAMGNAHALGLVHRDLKPENIIFTGDGRPLVADLGLAKHWTAEAPGASRSFILTTTGDFLGTVGYASPEQLEDTSTAGPPADVFALGAILYECLTAFPAFAAENAIELIGKVEECRPASVSRIAPRTPEWLARVVSRALAKDPTKRYPDGATLARALASGPGGGRRYRPLAPLALAALALVLFLVIPRTPREVLEAPPEVDLEPLAPWFGGPLEVVCHARHATRARFTLVEGDETIASTHQDVVEGVARVRLEARASSRAVIARVEAEDASGRSARAEVPVSLLPRAYEESARASTLRLREALGDPAFMHAGAVMALTLTSDDGVAAMDSWGDVRIWDIETGAERRHFSAALDSGAALVASPREKKLIAPGPGGLAIHDLSGGAIPLGARGEYVAAWSRDGTAAALGGAVEIRVVSARGEELKRIPRETPTTAVAFTPDGRRLMAGSADGNYCVWDTTTWNLLLTLEGEGRVNDVAVAPDGRAAVMARWNGSLHCIDLERLVGGRIYGHAHLGPVYSVAYSPDGKRIYSAGGDGRIVIWEGGRAMGVWSGSSPIAVARDGRSVLCGGVNRVRVLDARTGEERGPFRGHRAALTAVAPISSGRLVTAGMDGAVIVWSAGVPALLGQREWSIVALAVSPDERFVATANIMKEIRVRDLSARAGPTLASPGNVVGLAFDARSRLFVGGDDGQVTALAPPDLGRLWPPVRVAPAGLAAFWTDGEKLLAWGGRPALALTSSVGELKLDWVAPAPSGHALAVAPGGRWGVLGADDGSVTVFSLERGDVLRERSIHDGRILCVAVSPDGKRIATGGTDRTLRLLDAATLEEKARFALAPSFDLPLVLAFTGHDLLVGTARAMVLRVSER